MHYCALCGIARTSLEGKNLSFYFFPKDPDLKLEWVKRVNRPSWEPSNNSVMCSRHFSASDFGKSKSGRMYKLLEGAIPSLHLYRMPKKNKYTRFVKVDEKTLEEKPNSRSKYVKVKLQSNMEDKIQEIGEKKKASKAKERKTRKPKAKYVNVMLQNASKMEDKIPLMDIKVEPSIVGDQPTSDSEIMNQQRTVIADIIKSIMHSLDLLIKSDPDNIRSASVRDKIIVALFSYQHFIDEKQLNLTSYKQVDIFDNSNNLKEIHVVYNNDKDDNSEFLPDDSQKDVDNCIEEYISNVKNKRNNKIVKKKDASTLRHHEKMLCQLREIGIVYKDDNSVVVPDNDEDFYNGVAGNIEEYLTNIKNSEKNLIETNNKIIIRRKVCDLSNNDSNGDGFYNGIAESVEEYLSALKKREAELIKDERICLMDKKRKRRLRKLKRKNKKLAFEKTKAVADVSEVENDVVYPKYSKENLGFESTVPRYVCDVCEITAVSEHHLTVHKGFCKRRHYSYYGNPLLEEYWDKITCPLCDLKGKHKDNLARHYKSHKVKDIEAALASLKEKGLNPENPEGNMKLLNDFIQEFEYKEKVDGDELSLQSGNTIQVHTEGNICKKPSIDDYVKFNLKKIVYDVDINKELFCFPCDIMFQTKQDLEEHRKKINDTDAFVCNHCDKTFNIPYKLLRHVVVTHKGSYNPKSLYLTINPEDTEGCPRQIDYKLHACKYCLAIFTQEVSLQDHMKYYQKHGACFIKGQKLKKLIKKDGVQDKVKVRAKRRYSGTDVIGSYTCNDCDKHFNSRHYFMEHLASHSETFNYQCECGKKFKSKVRLKFHINSTHAKKFEVICEVCGMKMISFNLRRHMRVHSDLKPFKCSFCDNAFRSKGGLVVHTRTHTKEKPWKCKYCGMAFSERRTYNIHVNIHEGKTPYKCTECPSAFVSKLQLNKHVAEHQDCRNAVSKYNVSCLEPRVDQ